MANLQIKGMNDNLYKQIKALAGLENRSVSQQIIFMANEYLLKKQQVQAVKLPAQVLLDLAGSCEDEKTADEIISQLKRSRKRISS